MLDGSAAARGLTFTLTPDPVNGGILGAHIIGTVQSAGPLNIRVTASDAGPGAPLTVVDNFVINVQQNLGIPSTAVAPEVFTTALEDIMFTGTLLPGTDPTNDPLAYKLVANSATNGTVTVNANGTFLFTPTLDFAGDATFKYYVTEGLYNSTSKTVTVHFNRVDDGTATVMLTGTAAAGRERRICCRAFLPRSVLRLSLADAAQRL